jgi:hypothetical protein
LRPERKQQHAEGVWTCPMEDISDTCLPLEANVVS